MNSAIAAVIGRATGGPPPRVFTTLARHRRLFRAWLRFAGRLMPGGALPRSETELAILRVAHNCDSAYEWAQHERIALTAGLSAELIAAVRAWEGESGYTDRQRLVLEATDALHAVRDISDELWGRLRPAFSDRELIELCMLVGHYEMLAMTLNSLRVQPDEVPSGKPGGMMRAAQRLAERRAGS